MGSDICGTNSIPSNIIFTFETIFKEKLNMVIRFEGVGSAFTDHLLTKQNFAHDGEGNRATRYAFC